MSENLTMINTENKHKRYMKMAIELAKKGTGHVSPNPLVGAIIVKDGKIIGSGYHKKYGDLHAEIEALASCSQNNHCPKNATMYVTLEPCSHYGKQPPCAIAIIEAGIKTVYIGSDDPNPKVSGKGIKMLRDAGITVITGFMKDECDNINKIFFHYIKNGLPYVTLKYAMSLDGKIATRVGNSKWITGEVARKKVHIDRKKYSGIMVGIGTVLSDDPMLNCRLEDDPVNPIRIICDSRLSIQLYSKIVETAKKIPTIIAYCPSLLKNQLEQYCENADSEIDKKLNTLQVAGCRLVEISEKEGHLDLEELIAALGKLGIDSIIVEGGSKLNWSLAKAGLINHIQCYIGNKIIAGSDAKGPIGGLGFTYPDDFSKNGSDILIENVEILANDLLIEADIVKNKA